MLRGSPQERQTATPGGGRGSLPAMTAQSRDGRERTGGSEQPAAQRPRRLFRSGVCVATLLAVACGMIVALHRQLRRHTRRLSLVKEQLTSSAERYRHLFDALAQGVVIKNAEGATVAANPAAERILGLTLGQMQRRLPLDPRWRCRDPEGLAFSTGTQTPCQAFRAGVPVQGRLIGVQRPGDDRPRSISVDVIPERAGDSAKPTRVYLIFSDITDRKLAEEALMERTVELRDALISTIGAMSATVEKRDPYTAGHQMRVARLAQALAERLGLDADQVQGIHLGGLIHDIGKISISADTLAKTDALTAPEMAQIRQHPQVGYEILKNVKFPWPIAQMVYQHHERLDGSGYPKGLAGDAILLEARILAVADVIEAMTLRRPYREALGIEVALAEVASRQGLLYDARVVAACEAIFREGFRLDLEMT